MGRRFGFLAVVVVAALTALLPAPALAKDKGTGRALLLEASEDGSSGATPYSGSLSWKKGTDDHELPTIVANVKIPGRAMSVTMTLRKNFDESLPTDVLIEIDFKVSDTFVGGSISGLPGILMKNEELVQGTPLIGASARIVGNAFLFALSAAPDDVAANADLLKGGQYLDLAIVYATGRRAILTLEKDDAAAALFNDVLVAWGASRSQPDEQPLAVGGREILGACVGLFYADYQSFRTHKAFALTEDGNACGSSRGYDELRVCRRAGAPRVSR